MQKLLLSLAAAGTILTMAPVASAQAMTAASVPGIREALDNLDMMESARYVCVHRGWSARRCYWRPSRTVCRHNRYNSRRICRRW